MGAVERGRQSGREVVTQAGLVQSGKQRIGSDFRPRRDLGEGAVPLEEHGGVRQRGGDFVGGVIAEPGGEQTGEHVAVPVALALGAEVDTQRIGERRHRRAGARHVEQVAKMPTGQRDNHEPGSVAAGEVLPVLAVDGVAQPFALGADDLRLGEQPQVGRGGQRDVLQRQADPRAGPGLLAAVDGGDDGQRGIQSAAHVPGRQHVVDRAGVLGRAGDQRVADAGVDGVVHTGGAVAATE
ncbi:hypothetical protein PICSAR18_04194 [Mycobacterium avium subsp. paratuberculosis]|nr:hypothetical protein PICSAR18_04194 [Mycobacterium avium subsp. paratuberculosis]CAG7407075.1 hypothetical protein PICSAR78_04217 [Mycobacterium avium subsp. paratuberculosis]CAG7419045.1 hypothetical protein PICSAR94_04269 [Mycobacterium avium subsp. paratuberculosis]